MINALLPRKFSDTEHAYSVRDTIESGLIAGYYLVTAASIVTPA